MTWKLPKELEPFREYIKSFLLDEPDIVGRESLTIEEIVNNDEWKRNPILGVESIVDQLALLQRLIKAGLLNQWISVEDELPDEKKEEIIAWDSEEEMELPIHKPCLKWRDFFANDRDFITYWRYPINPPANGDKEDKTRRKITEKDAKRWETS